MEVWQDIKGYEGYYQISNTGKIKTVKRVIPRNGHGGKITITERILPNYFDNNGYQIAFLCKSSIKKTFKVHRLVAFAFLEYNKDRNVVNHIDGCKSNNNIKNLEWVTPSQNIRHADRMGLRVCASGIKNGHSIQIRDLLNGVIYESITHAAKANDVTHKIFNGYLRGKKRNERFVIV